MKKTIIFLLLIICSQTLKSQETLPWINAAKNWVNQAAKDINKSFKDVEKFTVSAVSETEKATLLYTKEIESFSTKLIDVAKGILNDIGKNPGDYCHTQVKGLYDMINPLIKNEISNLKINVTENNDVNQTGEDITKKAAEKCVECTQYALETFLCRLPESIQNNIAFMDKIKSAMENAEVKKFDATIRPIAAVAFMAKDDFVNQFKTNFELLKKIQEELKKSQGGRGLDINGLAALYSKEVCNELGNIAFEAMLGALKGKDDPNKVKKRYEILLDKVKKVFNDAKNAVKDLKVVKKGEKGYKRYVSLKEKAEMAQTVYSFSYPIGGIKNISIPKTNPIYSIGRNGNIFINSTGNGLWVDARNWSKQMTPMSYQIAYIPKGKTVNIDRPIQVRDIVNNNDSNEGIRGKHNISYTKGTAYLSGYTFAIKNKATGTYLAVAADSKVNGGNIIGWNNVPNHGTRNFTFIPTEDNDGSYYLRSKWSSLIIGVKGGFTFHDAPIEQWKNEHRNNQKVYIEEAESGFYKVKFKHTGMYLGVKNCSASMGAQIVQVVNNTGDCILFKFESATLSGRTFFIQTKQAGVRMLDKSLSPSDGNQIHIWDKNGNPNQQFYFRLAEVDKNGQEYYYIMNLNNYQYLINYSYGVTNGTKIVTAKDPGFNDWATMYYLEKYDDTYYYIKSRFGKNVNGIWKGNRCFDINERKTENGTKLQLWDCVNGLNSQLFKLIEKK